MQDSLKILETVNNFYSQSFGQLINITVAVLVFAGIVLPILITLYQKQLFKLEHQAIEKSLVDEMQKKLDEAITTVKTEYAQKEADFEDKISDLREQFHKELDAAKGGISHVQGNNESKQGLMELAFDSYIAACFSYTKAEDNLNLRRVLRIIAEDCLSAFTSLTISEHEESFRGFEALLDEIQEYNENGVFSDLISQLNKAYSSAKHRQPKKSDAAKT
ncbi:hypothetical protein [Shewanella frigidimarina]|uniref:hypothetical protein n=1 Tax=Shewanella frigidimarina TaxID=56812 RepID=UPI000F4ED592|nr:hypothetical protein [Shewanella frigidimarina]RPA23609.1 hypothetical protein EGC78_19115 [Shewanella frigidimarina]